jgi:hypothetical protein
MKRIWCTGSHGTGKTTQVEFFLRLHPEFHRVEMERRKLVENGIIKVNQKAAPWDEIVIAGCAMLGILSTPAPSISDRSWICKCAYSQALPFPKELLDAYHIVNVNSFPGKTEEDIYFYFPPSIPLEDDGVRSIDPGYQEEIDYYIQFYLDLFNINAYTILGDSVQDRNFEIEKTVFGKI